MILTVPASMVVYPPGMDPSINLQIDVGGYMGMADYGVSGLGDFGELGDEYLQDSTPLWNQTPIDTGSDFNWTNLANLITAGGNAAAGAIHAINTPPMPVYYGAGGQPYTGTLAVSGQLSSMLPILGILALGAVLLFAIKKG